MSAQPALPLIRPTLPGWVEGVVSAEPFTVQCQACGLEVDCASLGHPTMIGSTNEVALVVLTSHVIFHSRAWTSGHTDNPRLCRSCRLERGCRCESCRDERRGS